MEQTGRTDGTNLRGREIGRIRFDQRQRPRRGDQAGIPKTNVSLYLNRVDPPCGLVGVTVLVFRSDVWFREFPALRV
jgi:hypothetical protein